MNHKFYHIDAFTEHVFKGNSACVVLLSCELGDDVLLKIAAENNVAETAFILNKGGRIVLRWFTPDLEMDLCGHATLAAAYVVFHFMPEFVCGNKIVFDTCEGEIHVYREEGSDVYKGADTNIPDKFCLHFPVREGVVAQLPQQIRAALSIAPQEVYLSRDYLLVYDSPQDVLDIEINRTEFDKINLGQGGVVVSARGPHKEDACYKMIGKCDFVSRFFTPQATILEDPVTGSAHCTLAPYWGQRLGKTNLFAKQISARGGDLWCTLENGKVMIKGCAVCYMAGIISIESY
ncbi:MAG: PhzF family phenazine biosynthesis protein [Bacteroidales bacterium]